MLHLLARFTVPTHDQLRMHALDAAGRTDIKRLFGTSHYRFSVGTTDTGVCTG